MRYENLLLLFLTLFFLRAEAQRDLVSWSAFKIETSANDGTKFAIKPILRHNNDLSTYQNTSIEFIVNRNLGKKWFAQYLYRHWIWPDEPRVNFHWFDAGYNTSLGNSLKSSSAIRFHISTTSNRQSADFIRIREKISFAKGKIKPNIQLEAWWRFDNESEFSLIRLEPGFSWSIVPGVSFTFNYRIQTKYGNFGPPTEDHLVSSINYSF
ncbi:MAG: hypothetical protein P8M34_03365 [Saprospiraceae bacterium]|nr:hypothetical protein [Saprospiraceae bacterium]